MQRAHIVLAIGVFTFLSLTRSIDAAPSPTTADDWLSALTERVIEDVAAGKPLVVEVHVPLCDNAITACGNAKLGDGNRPGGNLYWATTPGFGKWFEGKGRGWTRALLTTDETGDKDVLELRVYKRRITASAAWRKRGAPKRFDVVLVLRAWRGSAIDRALAAYASDVSGQGARSVSLPDGTELAAGGAARIVTFVGHNRLMDLAKFDWPAAGSEAKGTIAIACHTAAYMKEVPASTRVPLLLTTDYLFSNAAPLEASVLTFATGGGYAEIRRDAASAYAGVRKRELRHVFGAFTNPSDRRWRSKSGSSSPTAGGT